MKQLKDASFYPKIYESIVVNGIFGMKKLTFYEVSGGVAKKFNELEEDKNLSPFPIIDVQNLGKYFNAKQLRFMRLLDMLNPQRYPLIESANIATGNILKNFIILEDQKVGSISLGERVVNSNIFILFAEKLKENHNNEVFYLTHGYRSEGYQLIYRTWLIGTFGRLYKNLRNCAPSRNTTHSLNAHAIDIGTLDSVTGKSTFIDTPTYSLFTACKDFTQEYPHEPWHFRPEIDSLVRVMQQGDYIGIEGKTIKRTHWSLSILNGVYNPK